MFPREPSAPVKVADWMITLGVAVTGPLRFDRIGLGQSNLTYLVRDRAERKWVLRRPPLGQLLASAHDVVREARILSALEATEVPVPRILGVTADAAVTDAPLVLMEFVDGLVVDRMPIARELAPRLRRDIGRSLPRTLAKIHAVDLKSAGLRDLSSHRSYAQRQLRRWSMQWEKSKTRELPALDSLTRRLSAAVPSQRELTLVHGDFHLRNVITSSENGEVIAALDWELATLGDPLADMGTLLAYWPQRGEAMCSDFAASTLDGFPCRDELAQIYLTETGRDPAALKFWHALGLWKIAVIAEGVRKRAIDEPQNRAAAGTPTAARVSALVDKAHEIADDAGM